MNSDTESIDTIHTDFYQFIRDLEKKKAFYSIFQIIDSFLVISDNFGLNPSEYQYFLEKYRRASVTNHDLSRSEITQFLASLITRLEKITDKKFDPATLPGYTPEELAQEQEDLKQELIEYPELMEILEDSETDTNIDSENGKKMLKKKETLTRKVKNLKDFQFQGTPPEIDYSESQKKIN